MIDSHAHIISEYYDDINSVVKELKDKGVVRVINAASGYKDAIEIIELSKKTDNYLVPIIGIHPENSETDKVEMIEELLKKNKVYGIGEIGLDYHWNIDKDKQKEVFINQIDLAIKYNLPVVVHTRDSIQDTYDILKDKKVKGVIHCFSGSYEMAKEFIKLGFKLGIGGVLTFKNSNLYKIIEQIDLDNLLIETDSPFLTPEPYRGQKNNPANVYYVAKKIAEIKNISIEEVIEKASVNTANLFDF